MLVAVAWFWRVSGSVVLCLFGGFFNGLLCCCTVAWFWRGGGMVVALLWLLVNLRKREKEEEREK